MALQRIMKYVYKNSHSCPDSPSVQWVGGSPIDVWNDTISGSGDYIGIAYHNTEFDQVVGESTVLVGPGQATIEEGTDTTAVTAQAFADPVAPWDTTQNYAIGDFLVPTTISSGGVTYQVWTNAGATGAGCYPAKITGLTGGPAGTNVTDMTIQFGSTPYNAA